MTTNLNAGRNIGEAITAAKKNDVVALKKWLDSGNDPNRYDADGWSPLLWAAARGNIQSVKVLLDHKTAPADPSMPHNFSKCLPIHLAGHSGSAAVADMLLAINPEFLDAVWDLNGHTVILQAVFYGHVELTRMLLSKGARTDITTARGLGPYDLASQFQNKTIMEIVRPFDSPAEKKAEYYRSYLKRIAPVVPPDQVEIQKLADEMIATIETGIKDAFSDGPAVDRTVGRINEMVETRKADVNRLGGPLSQPPLVAVSTGPNGFPADADVVRLRNSLAKYLLEHGADPTLHEVHPMGAQTIIRAAVFNHLEILKMSANYISSQQLTDAINEIPVVNGLTAMHDTVLRASMAAPDRVEGYMEQMRFFVSHGGRIDMEDFAGVTQRNIAEKIEDPDRRQRILKVLDNKE